MANLFNECFRVFDPQIGILFFESCSFSIVLLLYGTVALLILLLLLSSCCCYCIMLLQKYCVAILQRWQRRDSMWEFSTLSALTIESPLLASQHHLSVPSILSDLRWLPGSSNKSFHVLDRHWIPNSQQHSHLITQLLHIWHWCLLLIETLFTFQQSQPTIHPMCDDHDNICCCMRGFHSTPQSHKMTTTEIKHVSPLDPSPPYLANTFPTTTFHLLLAFVVVLIFFGIDSFLILIRQLWHYWQ